MLRPSCLLAFLLLLLASCESRRPTRHRMHASWEESDEQMDDENDLSGHDEDECHRDALHKCGQTFLRAHKLLSYLDDATVAFRTRCGIRTGFFECLKTTREKKCSRANRKHQEQQERHDDSDFRKRLTDKLWATRVCVMGVRSFGGRTRE